MWTVRRFTAVAVLALALMAVAAPESRASFFRRPVVVAASPVFVTPAYYVPTTTYFAPAVSYYTPSVTYYGPYFGAGQSFIQPTYYYNAVPAITTVQSYRVVRPRTVIQSTYVIPPYGAPASAVITVSPSYYVGPLLVRP